MALNPPPPGSSTAAPAQPTASTGVKGIFKRAGRFVRGGFYVFAGLSLINGATSLMQTYASMQDYLTLPEEFWLDVDLERHSLVERASTNPLQLLTGALREIELFRLVKVLDVAKSDARVKGVLATLGPRENFEGLAQLQELRNAVLDFKATASKRGAPIVAFCTAFGEGGTNGTAPYYLASAFDRVTMPDAGNVSLLGFEATTVFLRGMLDKLQVKFTVVRREEYKAAGAQFTDKAYGGPHKENMLSLLGDLSSQVLGGVAAGRGLSVQAVEAAMGSAPLLAHQGVQHHLLDYLHYKDQVEHALTQTVKGAQVLRATAAGAKDAEAAMARLLTFPGNRMGRLRLTRLKEELSQAQQALGAQGGAASVAVGGGAQQGIKQELRARVASLQQQVRQAEEQEIKRRHKGPRVSFQRYASIVEMQRAADQLVEAQKALGAALGMGQGALGWLGLSGGQATTAATDGGQRTTAPAPMSALPPSATQQQLVAHTLPTVAVVSAVGPIMQSAPPEGPAQSARPVIESRKLVQQLRALRENPQVKAVVLRVNSPGGSALASAVIARELQLLAKEKPLVVSMGDVAASGGYYMAAAAPGARIFAQPATITGSIGVITMKPYARELLESYGLNPDSLVLGPNANWYSPFHELTPAQRDMLEEGVEAVYQQFLGVVAEGRGMSREAVRKLAKGRVWTGQQAKEVGLVDELGGLQEAIAAAKEAAGLPQEESKVLILDVPARRIPPFISILSKLGALPSPDGDGDDSSASLGAGGSSLGLLGSGLARALLQLWVAAAWEDQTWLSGSSYSAPAGLPWLQHAAGGSAGAGSTALPGVCLGGSGSSGASAGVLALLAALPPAQVAALQHLLSHGDGVQMLSLEAEALSKCC